MEKPLKTLILLTICLSFTALFIPQLYPLFTLSWAGIKHLYLWQLITYVLIEPGPFSLGYLLQLGFNMYVLWMFGTTLIERSRLPLFFLLYFGASLVAGVASLAIPQTVLAGSTTAVFAILVAWIMINPGSQLLLFFAIPFKAHWLILGFIALSLFFDISSSNWGAALSLTTSVLFAYLFSLITWREQSPFLFLNGFERTLFRLLERGKGTLYRHSKIYDIKSGEPVLDDNQFMDAMLEKVSLYGEESLTPAEKKRMHKISLKKK